MGSKEVLATNLNALMKAYKKAGDNERGTPVAVATKAEGRLGKSTLYDNKKGASMRLPQLDVAAEILGVPAWMLLYPNLDPADKPVVRTKKEFDDEIAVRVREILQPIADKVGLADDEEGRSDGRSSRKPYGDLKTPRVEQAGEVEPSAVTAKRGPRKTPGTGL